MSLFDKIAPSGMKKVLSNWMDSYVTSGLVPCYTTMFITLFDPGSHNNYENEAKSIWQQKTTTKSIPSSSRLKKRKKRSL